MKHGEQLLPLIFHASRYYFRTELFIPLPRPARHNRISSAVCHSVRELTNHRETVESALSPSDMNFFALASFPFSFFFFLFSFCFYPRRKTHSSSRSGIKVLRSSLLFSDEKNRSEKEFVSSSFFFFVRKEGKNSYFRACG